MTGLLEQSEAKDAADMAGAEASYQQLLARYHTPNAGDVDKLRKAKATLGLDGAYVKAEVAAVDLARDALSAVLSADAIGRLDELRAERHGEQAEAARQVAVDVFRDLVGVEALHALIALIDAVGKRHGFPAVAPAKERAADIAAEFNNIDAHLLAPIQASAAAAVRLETIRRDHPRAYAVATAAAK